MFEQDQRINLIFTIYDISDVVHSQNQNIATAQTRKV